MTLIVPSTTDTPYGYCHCGCGEKTNNAPRTHSNKGIVKGSPQTFLRGHQRTIRPIVQIARPFKIEGVYCRLISLTQGQYTIVDDDDYLSLMQWKWCAHLAQLSGRYYAQRSEKDSDGNNRIVLMHRQILGLAFSDPTWGDHIRTKETLDNRRLNLRKANLFESAANRGKQKNNSSGLKGAFFSPERNKWTAQIQWRGVKNNLGFFSTKEEAYEAYCNASKNIHREFANY